MLLDAAVKVKRQLCRDKKMSKKIKERYNIEIPRRSINNYRKMLDVLLKQESKEFRFWSKICQARKQANLKKKFLQNSCSFEKIVNKISTERCFKRTKRFMVF